MHLEERLLEHVLGVHVSPQVIAEAALDAFRIDDAQCQIATWTTYGSGCAAGAGEAGTAGN